MENHLRTLASLLLLVSLLGSSSLLAYCTEQTHTLTKLTPSSVRAIANQVGPDQAAPGSPCLPPSAADTSTALVQAGSSNSSIPGNVVPIVQVGKASRTGSVPSPQPVHLELVFSLRHPTQFNQCLDSIMEPQSPNYGHFLNATTLQPYLPTPGEKASITSFFTNAGFTVTQGASPLVLQLSGTIAATEDTLGVALNYYQVSGSTFYATNTNPSLPSAYANLVTGVIGLDNYSTPKPVESPCSGTYCPQGVQVGYSLTNLYSAGDNGAGQTVAVIDEPGDPHIQTAINTYSTQYSLPSITLNVLTPDGTPSSYDGGWATETALDVEAVHTVAPGASITLLYGSSTSDDPMNLVNYVATNHLANIVSNSWVYTCTSGICSDTQFPSGFVSGVDSELATDVARGVTILFASGDNGAKPDGTNFGTEFPASDPNVLAVGATNLALTGCGMMTCTGYSGETGASISGGGYSGYFAEPNWQTSTIGSTASKCTAGHLNPTCRAVPDISMLGYEPGIWVYSTISAGACNTSSTPAWYVCSGTSLATPLWAGFLAIVLQLRNGVVLGNLGPLLYQTASGVSYSSDFHDVTSGTNNGYSAGIGWDPVTGWGSPIANNLAVALASASVVFTTVPSSFPVGDTAGSISACGGMFSEGQSNPCPNTFSASANLPSPSIGWRFDQWTWTGGVSCSSRTANPTNCILSGVRGYLTAVFAVQVTFATSNGVSIGWGSCAGPNYGNEGSVYNMSGSSVAACYVPVGYTFSNWTCPTGLACASSNDPTIVTVTWPGTLTLNLKSGSLSTPVSTMLTASAPANPAPGSPFTVIGTLTPNGGGVTEPIVCVFSWSTNIVTVPTNPDGSYTCTAIAPTTPGSYNVDVFFLGDYSGSPQYLPSKAAAMITVT